VGCGLPQGGFRGCFFSLHFLSFASPLLSYARTYMHVTILVGIMCTVGNFLIAFTPLDCTQAVALGFPVKARAGPVEGYSVKRSLPSGSLRQRARRSHAHFSPPFPPRHALVASQAFFLRSPRLETPLTPSPVPLARYIQQEFNLVGLNARIYSPRILSWVSALSTSSRPHGISPTVLIASLSLTPHLDCLKVTSFGLTHLLY